MSRAVLAFERVTYRYPGTSDAALHDVSLDLLAGEFCVLAGLSGSGKSTLLRAACGLVPHFHGGHFYGGGSMGGSNGAAAGSTGSQSSGLVIACNRICLTCR